MEERTVQKKETEETELKKWKSEEKDGKNRIEQNGNSYCPNNLS